MNIQIMRLPVEERKKRFPRKTIITEWFPEALRSVGDIPEVMLPKDLTTEARGLLTFLKANPYMWRALETAVYQAAVNCMRDEFKTGLVGGPHPVDVYRQVYGHKLWITDIAPRIIPELEAVTTDDPVEQGERGALIGYLNDNSYMLPLLALAWVKRDRAIRNWEQGENHGR